MMVPLLWSFLMGASASVVAASHGVSLDAMGRDAVSRFGCPSYAKSTHGRIRSESWLSNVLIPRGGDRDEEGEDDADDSLSVSNSRPGNRPSVDPSSTSYRRRSELPPKPSSSSSSSSSSSPSSLGSIAQQSLKLTQRAVQLTARQSTKAAYHVLRPKTVGLDELVGLWRVDQELSVARDDNGDANNVFTMELAIATSPRGRDGHRRDERFPPERIVQLTITDGSGTKTVARQVQFKPSSSPLTHAQLKWTYRGLQYKAAIHRKLADPSVLKLKGTITYRPPPPPQGRGLLQAWSNATPRRRRDEKVGTFVARRRMKFEDELEEEEDDVADDEYDDEEESGHVYDDDEEDEKRERSRGDDPNASDGEEDDG
jgi:hypothetical protein